MKKRIFLALTTVIVALFILTIGASAVELVTSTSDEFGTVNIIEGVNSGYTLSDTTSRVVLKHGENEYVTFPTYYISDTKLDWEGKISYKFDALNTAVADLDVSYDINSIVRLELLTDAKKISSEYQNKTNLKEIVLHKNTNITQLPNWGFRGSGLETFVVPSGITTFGNYLFENCKSLKTVTFEEGYTGTKISDYAFNGCSSLEEIVLPNTTEEIGKNAFSGCSSLKMINFGASFKTMGSRAVWYATKWYAPSTFMKDFTGTMDSNFFGDTYTPKVVTIYFTGTKEEAEALRAKSTHTEVWNGSHGFKNARIVEYDPTKTDDFYVSDIEWTIVYNYNTCKAFYDNEHKAPVEVNKFEGKEYLSAYKTYEGCDRCNQLTEKSTICEAIYLYKGFSTDGEGLFYDIKVNTEAMQIYTEKTSKALKYGIVISQLTNDGKLVNADESAFYNNVLLIKLTGTEYSSLQVKIFNIADSLKTMQIHCCAYIIDDSGVNYLYDVEDQEGERAPNLFDVANKVSYSDIDK